MSGGVDSSVTAILLLQEGYDVVGVTLKLTDEEENSKKCCGTEGVRDAHDVAVKAGFPHHAVNCQKEFYTSVVSDFIDNYLDGKTPSPCIKCNKHLKFGYLLKMAHDLDADYVATGHYARVGYDKTRDRYLLKKGMNEDQSYFLFSLSQEQLAGALFPLGEIPKTKVREVAADFGLSVSSKPGSQEICFVPDDDYRGFLKKHVPDRVEKPGPIIDWNDNVIGEHTGIAFYTIGQRKGLGAHTVPVYVSHIDVKNNAVHVVEDKDLYQKSLYMKQCNWIDRETLSEKIDAMVKIRYQAKESKACIHPPDEHGCLVEFETPQRAITPGQAVVLYDEDSVIGGGWIDRGSDHQSS